MKIMHGSFCAIAILAAALPVAALADVSLGEKIAAESCAGCHDIGLMDAPKVGDHAAWSKRLENAGSVQKLVYTAEHGKGNMPPRGGESTLTDQEVEAAVKYILSKSGVTF